MFGRHNVQNSLAAIAAAHHLGIDPATIRQGFNLFQGVKRRFTKIGVVNDITIIDDYGHHPVEIRAVLQTARAVAKGRVIAVIQPHRYTRVHDLFEDFARCAEAADHIILTPIYSAGEPEIEGISHHTLSTAMHTRINIPTQAIDDPMQLPKILAEISQPGDYIVFLGAGSITEWANNLPQQLEALCCKEVS
jgi:UDP-N-acetylmuramate--alanine ligase